MPNLLFNFIEINQRQVYFVYTFLTFGRDLIPSLIYGLHKMTKREDRLAPFLPEARRRSS
jgi:hypothetical protein